MSRAAWLFLLLGCAHEPAPPWTCPSGSRAQHGTLAAGRYERHCERGGLRDGPAAVWFADGVLAERGGYQRGARDGEWTFWHPNGAQRERGVFVAGQRHGVFQFWDDT